jgi:hypothetical protein
MGSSFHMKGFWFVAFLFFYTSEVFSQETNDSLITVLKREVDQKDVYVQQKLERIEALRKSLLNVNQLGLEQQFNLYNQLYHEYKTFIYDSAFKYSEKLIETAYRLQDRSKIGYSRLKLSFILISSGMFKETFDSLKVVEVKHLADTSRVEYYRLIARTYSDLNVYNKDHHYKKYYSDLNQIYMDSALRWCIPGSYQYYYLTVVKNIHIGNNQKVVDTIDELLKKHKLTNPQLAVNYYDLANAYKGLGDDGKTIRYTILSSLSDIRAATKETASMYTLARQLYEKGDVTNAYIFIQQAVDDADFYGARQRKVEIGSILPLIATAELNNSEAQRKRWLQYVIGLSILSALVMLFAVIIFKQLRKLKVAEMKIKQANSTLQEMNSRLQEANKIKEEYIGYYFSINSEYLDKIESFKRSVEQKLTYKKYDDIRFIVNNINAKRERDELYFSFDKVFLKLFPDFVKTFNSYFNPEDQFELKEGQLLNTELRIFALIRMGITDAEDIARILNYSVNTIYAYKTRLRNKSILPNEIFDQKIMEIKAI